MVSKLHSVNGLNLNQENHHANKNFSSLAEQKANVALKPQLHLSKINSSSVREPSIDQVASHRYKSVPKRSIGNHGSPGSMQSKL